MGRAAARRGRAADRARPAWSAAPARRPGREFARRPGSSPASATRRPDAVLRYSPQERWENQSGYSPNSIAAQISGLVCAADIARKHGPQGPRAESGRGSPTGGSARVDDWTVTPNGPLSDSAVLPEADQERRTRHRVARTRWETAARRSIDQRAVVDPSPPHPGAVRAAPRPTTPRITNSLEVVDENLKVDTPNGPFWRRFSHDGYGETRTGGGVGDHRPRYGHHTRPRLADPDRRTWAARRLGRARTPASYLAAMAAAANDQRA